MREPRPLFVGVDGGATSVKTWAVVEREGRLSTRGVRVAREYETLPGFAPTPLALQLDESENESESANAAPDDLEEAQAWVVVHAAADAVARLAEREGAETVRLGVCMPGRPTPDGRGIRAMRHGPRIPRFLERLEECLAVRGVALAERPERIWSDGEAAVAGEEHGAEGALCAARSALVVGLGTGVAEGWKVLGRCLARDEAAERFTPAWELAIEGRPFEDVLSMRAMNAEFRRRVPGATAYPEDAALAGDETARALLARAADAFARLIFHRLEALGETEPGAVLERVVVGQHGARLIADAALATWYATPLRNGLASLLRAAQDGAMRERYLVGGALDPAFVVPSRLPAASAVGAVALETGFTGGA